MYIYIYVHVHGRDVNINNDRTMYYTAVLIDFRILLKDGHIRTYMYYIIVRLSDIQYMN